MPDLHHLHRLRTDPEKVYAALTTPEGVQGWWTQDATVDAQAGGGLALGFGGTPERRKRLRIAELTQPARVIWRVEECFLPDDSGSVLRFSHRGFREANDIFAITTTGWGYYLVSLKQYLEQGAGAPHPYVDFTRVLRG
jgi:uncharacterized protein YndB with AHSA1/START domain